MSMMHVVQEGNLQNNTETLAEQSNKIKSVNNQKNTTL